MKVKDLGFRLSSVIQGNSVDAVYTEAELPSHAGSPLNESLHPILDEKKAVALLRRPLLIDPVQRSLPPRLRCYLVMKLFEFVEVLPHMIELEQKISILIREGYAQRNFAGKKRVEYLNKVHKQLELLRGGAPYVPCSRNNNINGFNVFGSSGSGKSFAVENILFLTDQVINHTQYQGRPFDLKQLVWMKLEYPSKGTFKALAHSFFSTVDKLLGTDYMDDYKIQRKSDDQMFIPMAEVAASHCLGLLAIDELRLANNTAITEQLVQLNNIVGCPIIRIGTFKAMEFIQQSFPHARRGVGLGDQIIANMHQDEEWDYFLDSIWEYQWTKIFTPVNDKISKVMYEETQGLVDMVVKLFVTVQLELIGNEDETITPQIIHQVAREKFSSVRPFLNALKNKDIDRLKELEDLIPANDVFEDYLRSAEVKCDLPDIMNTIRNARLNVGQNRDQVDPVLLNIMLPLTNVGYDQKLAYESAMKAINRHAHETDMKAVLSDALQFAEDEETKRSGADAKEIKGVDKTSKYRKRKKKSSNDLREEISPEIEVKDTYESLVEAGVVKNSSEFLEGQA